ncbi:MAG TPA: protoporphyrinogen oxidase HemJ [Micropepsaceae bacterium]|jgi:putative membrane protein|nr:protoporphyrinogen oxidase HemJ [Micropepsaceae bacterium]
MVEGLAPFYPWIKAFHIIAVISWMAGMLYLPRLYFYHCDVPPGSAESVRFQTMERRLLRIIVNPAMIAVWLLGLTLAVTPQVGGPMQGWLMVKLACVVALSAVHGLFSRWRKDFANDRNRHSKRFYAVWNEVPAVLMIAIVILVVVKPF